MRRVAKVRLGALAGALIVSAAVLGSVRGTPRPSRDPAALGAATVSDGAEPLPQQGPQEAWPADWPERFGFGTPATAERIARWDIDVKPDGEGLPPGMGTVSEGESVYRRRCRSCHGPTATEGPNDALVATEPWDTWPPGRAVGLYWPYATTLFDYISKAMPQKRPGSLTADETYAVIAYILHLNGIVEEDAVMSAETLPAVRMPARDRFVPDDRTGGPVIR